MFSLHMKILYFERYLKFIIASNYDILLLVIE
jgi:hypothetical protein